LATSFFHCKHIHSDHAVLPRDTFLAGSAKRIEPFAQRNIDEADPPQDIYQFSLRESACDSTSPEIDIASHGFG
jgi:hypothetical protein